MPAETGNSLGSFLRERRARLDPADFGFPLERRRTPGLRREEVAQLAHVSPTWYTWLEQGRGGAPSTDVLDRLARALTLSQGEREHLFFIAQGRPPKIDAPPSSSVSPSLQRVLDAFADSPAIVKTPDWTVVAWNRAATAVLVDYAALPEDGRNLLRIMFLDGRRSHLPDWEAVARLILGSVRRDIARAGVHERTRALIAELSESSADFRRLWAEQDVQVHGEGTKRLLHPSAGELRLEYSTFAVDGHLDLALVLFNPATAEDRQKVRKLVLADER